MLTPKWYQKKSRVVLVWTHGKGPYRSDDGLVGESGGGSVTDKLSSRDRFAADASGEVTDESRRLDPETSGSPAGGGDPQNSRGGASTVKEDASSWVTSGSAVPSRPCIKCCANNSCNVCFTVAGFTSGVCSAQWVPRHTYTHTHTHGRRLVRILMVM